MNIPWYQKIITYGVFLLAGFLALGGFLDSISNALSVITFDIALSSTILLALFYLASIILFKKRMIKWVLKNGREITYIAFGPKIILGLVGCLILLWLPIIISAQKKPAVKLTELGITKFETLNQNIDTVTQCDFEIMNKYSPLIINSSPPYMFGKTFSIPFNYSITLSNFSSEDISIIGGMVYPLFGCEFEEDAVLPNPFAVDGFYDINAGPYKKQKFPILISKNGAISLDLLLNHPITSRECFDSLLTKGFINRSEMDTPFAEISNIDTSKRENKGIKLSKKGQSISFSGKMGDMLGLTYFKKIPTTPLIFHKYKEKITSQDLILFFRNNKFDYFGQRKCYDNIQFVLMFETSKSMFLVAYIILDETNNLRVGNTFYAKGINKPNM